MNNGKKRGRKPKPFVFDGKHINGLRKRPSDGRWELSDGSTFVESDEAKAVAKFLEITRPLTNLPSWENSPVYDLQRGFTLIGGTIGGLTAEERMWRWFGQQVLTIPKLVAKKTGVEEIAYLKKIAKPENLPTFAELEKVWKDHFKKSPEQKRRVLHHWEDFKKATGVKAIDDITHAVSIQYRDAVYARKLSAKMQSNIFTRIRRLLTFAKSRAVAPKALGEAIDALALLTPDDTTTTINPQPIEKSDFHKLLDAADPETKAMLLLMLNGAYYLQEVVRLKWSDINNGAIVNHRAKSGKIVRVAVLWQETIDALAKLKRKGDFIFVAYTGLPLGIKGAELRFRNLRTAAEVGDEVKSSHIRDGAATAAAEANVNTELLNLLLGHRSGINDLYVKRNPKMVKPAAEAVHGKYFS
jgi:integrase